MPELEPGQIRNHRGEVLDRYGRDEVYKGYGDAERYLVWYGWHTSGSFSGHRQTFRTLRQAVRCAKGYERRGYDTKITDRAVSERVSTGSES